MKTIVSILFFGFLLYALETANVPNGFKDRPNEPELVRVSVIDQEQARDLFRKFASNKEIPFRYPIDGCYARATMMAQMAEQDSVEMGKIYASGYLRVKTDLQKYQVVEWGWHVAPIAFVKQSDGTSRLMAFDPSLFDGPVTVDDWKNRMLYADGAGLKPNINRTYYGTRFQYLSGGTYRDSWIQSDLDNVKVTVGRYHPLQDQGSLGEGDGSKASRTGAVQ